MRAKRATTILHYSSFIIHCERKRTGKVFMIIKLKNVFIKHKIGIIIFMLLPLYHFVFVNQAQLFKVSDITYSFFCVDFSMGFCDKFFVGEIYHLIAGKYTPEAASFFVFVFYVVFIVLIACLLDKFALAFGQNKKACIVLIGFALVGPFSFSIFIKQFGMLDFFWAFLFFFALVFLNHKYLKFLVPVFAVMMVFVHYASIICYVPALLLIIAFYALKSDSKKERISYIIILCVSAVFTVGFTFYFLKHDAGNLVYSVDGFRHVVQEQRGALSAYYDITYYKELPLGMKDSSLYAAAYEQGYMGGNAMNYAGFFEALLTQIKTTFILNSWQEICVCIIVSLIPWSFLLYVLRGYLKKASVPKKAVAVLLILLCMMIEFIGCFLSTDTPRWVAHALILLFTFVFLLLYFDYGEGVERVEKLFTKTGGVFVYVLLFFFSNMILDPYTFKFI
ncbi:MAG: hypothetical protein IKE65_01770 [Clostridia bacterium]|nr:hypothetical protein [Clostridia bacterium]